MEENKCILCFEVYGSSLLKVNKFPEIKSYYLEITSLTLDNGDDEEIGVCAECKKSLENCCFYKRFIVSNRERMASYIVERKLQLQEVQIKVEEVSAEDYQIIEQYETAEAVQQYDGDQCFFCHSQDALGMKQKNMPLSNFTCPACGRSKKEISLYSCPICNKKHTSINHFRQHFILEHSRNIAADLKCFVCNIFFFNEKARNVHGQMMHCISCRFKWMKDNSLIIPFEDHAKKCKDRTVMPAEIQVGGVTVRKVKVPVGFVSSEKIPSESLLIRKIVSRGNKCQKILKVPYTRMGQREIVERKKQNVDSWETDGKHCTLCHNELRIQLPPQRGIFYCCCPRCGLTVSNLTSLPVTCTFCTHFTATKLSQLRLHFIIHHGKSTKFVKCEQCLLSFYSRYALLQHKKVCRSHKKDVDKEELPRVSSAVCEDFEKHSETPTTTIPIEKDSESFKSILPDIIEEHLDPEPIPSSPPSPPVCKVCELPDNRTTSFDLNSQLNAPCIGCGRNVNRQMKKKCVICGDKHPIRAMAIHFKTTHSDQKLVDCPMENCERKFLSKTAMEKHKICHTLKCACGEVLKNHRALKLHRESCVMKGDLEQVIMLVEEEIVEPPPAKKWKIMKKKKKEEISKITGEDPLENERERGQKCKKEVQKVGQENVKKPLKLKKATKRRGRPKGRNAALIKSRQPQPHIQEAKNVLIPDDFDPLAAAVEFQTCEVEDTLPLPPVSNKKRKQPLTSDPLTSPQVKETIGDSCAICDFQDILPPGEATSTCPKCQRPIKMTENLRMKLEKFKCSLCSFKTFDGKHILEHISYKHSRSKVVFQCNICLATMESESLLKDHNLKSHSFICTICTTVKKFLSKQGLDEHMKKHQEKKPGEVVKAIPSCELIEIN